MHPAASSGRRWGVGKAPNSSTSADDDHPTGIVSPFVRCPLDRFVVNLDWFPVPGCGWTDHDPKVSYRP